MTAVVPAAPLGTEFEAKAPLPVLRSALLSRVPGVVHGVTGRVPGFGLAEGNVGYGPPRDPTDAWAMRQSWSRVVGIDPERLTAAGQVHGADVLPVQAADAGRGARPGSTKVGIADALITNEAGVALLSLHADCMPILLVDPRQRAIGVVHAGWRGTVADVAGAAVRSMSARFGSEPGDLLAFLGPAIGPCCYEVGDEVVGAWEARDLPRGDRAVRRGRRGIAFDLATANQLLLEQNGVDIGRIEWSGVCTACGSGTWFSHRAQGPDTGRFGAIIALV